MNVIDQIADTCEAMQFYPSGNNAVRREIVDLCARMIGNKTQADKFRLTLRDRVPKWPGLAELRAIYSTLFTPNDGLETASTVPGFTGPDLESDYEARESKQSSRKLLAWSQEQRLLCAPEAADAEQSRELTQAIETVATRKALAVAAKPAEDEDTRRRRERIREQYELLELGRALSR